MESGSNNSIRVLCTRPIPVELVEEAAAKGIAVDVLSFIETEPIESVEVQQEIENALILSATVVFTSMNAVEAVAEYLFDEQPDWKIYCMGNTTRQLVKKYFGEQAIQSTAENATALAEKIVENEMPEEVLFFCGDQRRDELPQLLKQQDVEVNEIVVYHTIPVPHKLSTDYTAVLFFSPSAVESFFSANKAGDKTIFFAIGNTTALAIKKHTANRVLIGDAPGKEELVKDMISFFAG
jgi:uroporphyrinogen-III synthase